MGEVIERTVAEQLQDFLGETSAPDPFQSGFRPGLSITTALGALMNYLQLQFDQGRSVLLILLNIAAALSTLII